MKKYEEIIQMTNKKLKIWNNHFSIYRAVGLKITMIALIKLMFFKNIFSKILRNLFLISASIKVSMSINLNKNQTRI